MSAVVSGSTSPFWRGRAEQRAGAAPPHGVLLLWAARFDAPLTFLGGSTQGLDADIALGADREGQLGRRLIVRRLGNDHGVVPSGHQVEVLQLRTGGAIRLLGGIEPGGTLAYPLDALLREPQQRDVCGHDNISSLHVARGRV